MKKEKQLLQKIKLFLYSINPLYLLIILLFPLFFINIHSFTDWGDDFALYLHQAKKIAEGISPQKTRLIYNPDNPIMISNVSVGFSLLLVPVYMIFGLNFKAFSVLTTFFLILAGIAVFYFLKKYMPARIAVIMVLLLLYHRWTLDFKQYVLSDIPFAFIFFSILYVYLTIKNRNIINTLLLGAAVGYMLNVRTAGIVFIGGISIEFFIELLKSIKSKATFKKHFTQAKYQIIIIITALSFSFILKKIAFPEPAEGGYLNYFSQHNILNVISTNINNYFNWFKWFFTFKKIPIEVQYSIFYLFIIVFIVGFIKKILFNLNIIDYCFILFGLLLIIYPANPGFRYLFPLMPFFFLYFYHGAVFFSGLIRKKWGRAELFIPLIILILYYPGIVWHIETKDYPVGTEQKSTEDVFDFIINNTDKDDLIVFCKPRALSLYTGRFGMANLSTEKNPDRLNYLYNKYDVDYLLQNTAEIPDTALMIFLEKYSGYCNLVYSNDKFRLFQLKKR